MARSRNPNKRGTRMWGPISGTTFQTQPSGVTIDSTNGIEVAAGTISPTEFSYFDGAGGDVLASDAGTGMSLTGASVVWAGTSLNIVHGFTTLQGITAIYTDATNRSDASPVNCQIIQNAAGDANGAVSVIAVVPYDNLISTALAAAGGTVFWTAFGK